MNRIRILTAAIAILAATFTASAQREYDPHLWIGARAGMTLSRMEFSPPVGQSLLPGKTFGFSIRYIEEKVFGLVGELVITQRGWREDFDENYRDKFHYDRSLTYIELPVMTHIYFGGRKVKGFFNAGPSVAYLIGDKIKADFDYRHPEEVEGFPYRYRRTEQLSMDIANKFDYGIQAGAGAEMFFGRHSLYIEGRYYYGLGSIFPSHKSDTFTASRGTSIIVSLGYYFRVK